MSKTYYKVLSLDLRSIITDAHHLITQYKIGEFVSSPEPMTPLCVFSSLYEARSFAQSITRRFIIYKCEIKNKYRKPWIPWLGNSASLKKDIQKLVKLKKQHKKFIYLVHEDLPYGTVCCGQVKLIKQV